MLEHFLQADLAYVAAGGATGSADVELAREVTSYTPVVITVLEGLAAMPPSQEAQHLRDMYPLLVDLITCSVDDVRRSLQHLFAGPMQRVLLGGTESASSASDSSFVHVSNPPC